MWCLYVCRYIFCVLGGSVVCGGDVVFCVRGSSVCVCVCSLCVLCAFIYVNSLCM
jgi:hypothetical protein